MADSQKPFELNSNDVHIWSASLLVDKNNTDYFYSVLSEDERKRADSFKFYRDQQRFIFTRGMLRCLLSKYLELSPESIEILYGLWGKPCLSEDMPLYFNVSHSGDYALYALALNNEVGIDIEYINKTLELNDIAGYVFSPEELAYWNDLDSEEKIRKFFKRWVSKEAFLKALGKGWAEDKEEYMRNFQKELLIEKSKGRSTCIHYFDLIPGYASALYVDGAALRPLYYAWDQTLGR